MITAYLEPADAAIVRQGLQDLTDDLLRVGRLSLYRTSQRIVKRITTPPSRFETPETGFPWRSLRQIRFVMASIGEGSISVPYRRTGEYKRSWEIERTEEGYIIYSTSPIAPIVSGTFEGGKQADIHVGRWEHAQLVFEEEVERLPERVAAAIHERIQEEWRP